MEVRTVASLFNVFVTIAFQLELFIASLADLKINSEDNRPLRCRVVGILGELHELRNTESVLPSKFPKRMLAKSISLSPYHLTEYVNRKLDEDTKKISGFLEGKRRLYDLIEIDIEEKFHIEVQRQLEASADTITDAILSSWIRSAVEDFVT
jgi:hypothetical protein